MEAQLFFDNLLMKYSKDQILKLKQSSKHVRLSIETIENIKKYNLHKNKYNKKKKWVVIQKPKSDNIESKWNSIICYSSNNNTHYINSNVLPDQSWTDITCTKNISGGSPPSRKKWESSQYIISEESSSTLQSWESSQSISSGESSPLLQSRESSQSVPSGESSPLVQLWKILCKNNTPGGSPPSVKSWESSQSILLEESSSTLNSCESSQIYSKSCVYQKNDKSTWTHIVKSKQVESNLDFTWKMVTLKKASKGKVINTFGSPDTKPIIKLHNRFTVLNDDDRLNDCQWFTVDGSKNQHISQVMNGKRSKETVTEWFVTNSHQDQLVRDVTSSKNKSKPSKYGNYADCDVTLLSMYRDVNHAKNETATFDQLNDTLSSSINSSRDETQSSNDLTLIDTLSNSINSSRDENQSSNDITLNDTLPSNIVTYRDETQSSNDLTLNDIHVPSSNINSSRDETQSSNDLTLNVTLSNSINSSSDENLSYDDITLNDTLSSIINSSRDETQLSNDLTLNVTQSSSINLSRDENESSTDITINDAISSNIISSRDENKSTNDLTLNDTLSGNNNQSRSETPSNYNLTLSDTLSESITSSRDESQISMVSNNVLNTISDTTGMNVTIKKHNNMRILYSNVDSLNNKLHELLLEIGIHRPDIMMITEVLPKNEETKTTKDSISINGFELFTNISDENIRGIAVYIKGNVDATEVKFTSNDAENVWCNITLNNKDNLLLGCIYRSPSHENTDNLCSLIKEVYDTNPNRVIITGDFNYPEIDWKNWHTTKNDSHRASKFLKAIQDTFWFQHTLQPTRYRENQTPSLIDLVLTSEEDMITNIQYLPPLGKSDHIIMIMDTNLDITDKDYSMRYAYDKGNYEEIMNNLGKINWTEVLSDKNTEEAWEYFEQRLIEEMDKNIPKYRVKQKKPYVDREMRRKMKKKYYLWKRYKQTNCSVDLQNYKITRNDCRNTSRLKKSDFERNLIYKMKKGDSKPLYKYANLKLKSRCRISQLKKSDGSLTTNDSEKAETLNNFFSSVFTEEDTTNMPSMNTVHDGDPMKNITVNESMVKKRLKKLKVNKSAGPDGLHPKFLKEISESIIKPLTILYNKSLTEGVVPKSWKDAHVTALHKKGSKQEAKNYRPISLTSLCSKMLEAIVRDHMIDHMLSNKLFADQQHGFVPNRSCMTQLLYVLEDWTRWLDNNNNIDTIFLDFQKAFDSVPHERLLVKLKAYGITGKTAIWIADFLKNRRQRVSVGKEFSSWKGVTSGIPQGSVLGPTLFVLFINDLPQAVESTIKIFADDTKMYRIVNNDEDRKLLQKDLDKLYEWSQTWQISFNASKCKVMHKGRSNTKSDYIMDGTILDATHSEKDLGVLIDNELKFHQHVSATAQKANQVLGIVNRTFETLDEELLPIVYKTQVRPHLEYGNIIWHPRYVADIKKIESVQRRATKLIPGYENKTYKERLEKLNLYSMVYRRKRGDMIQVYKIMNNIDRVDANKFFTLGSQRTRNHGKKLFKPRCEKDIRKGSFSHRVVDDWNSLPSDVVNAVSLNAFKNRLDKHWKLYWYTYQD